RANHHRRDPARTRAGLLLHPEAPSSGLRPMFWQRHSGRCCEYIADMRLSVFAYAVGMLTAILGACARDSAPEKPHIVFVTGDEEYRSEGGMPMLAKILAERHGFRCTVLFAVDPETGEVDPGEQTHIPGLEALETADLMVLFTRFRELPDADMQRIIDFTR